MLENMKTLLCIPVNLRVLRVQFLFLFFFFEKYDPDMFVTCLSVRVTQIVLKGKEKKTIRKMIKTVQRIKARAYYTQVSL